MSSNLQNSIWPNAGGTLGQNKVQIPTGTDNDPWPTGDALVHNFVFNKGKLVGFIDTKALIANDSKSTIFPYEYVNISLPSIAEGEMTYNHDQCAYFILNGKVIKGDVPSDDDLEEINFKYMGCKTIADIDAVDPNYLTNDIVDGVWSQSLADLEDASGTPANNYGPGMFRHRSELTTFNSELPNLVNGSFMFYGTNLSEFLYDLPNLTNGYGMFYNNNFNSFDTDLSSLTDGSKMFYSCFQLTSFFSDLSSLTNGSYMFNNCYKLTSFTSDLSSLTNGSNMFYGCGILASFTSDLSNLTDGNYMFYGCNLDTPSVQNIADTINTYNGEIFIGIGNSEPNEQEEAAFNTIASKGWTVYVNGSEYTPTSPAAITTLDENGEETITPIPYWAKPVPSDEEHAEYVDAQGNFFNILGGQFIYGDNLETYGMFTCEADAAANMRLTKIVK